LTSKDHIIKEDNIVFNEVGYSPHLDYFTKALQIENSDTNNKNYKEISINLSKLDQVDYKTDTKNISERNYNINNPKNYKNTISSLESNENKINQDYLQNFIKNKSFLVENQENFINKENLISAETKKNIKKESNESKNDYQNIIEIVANLNQKNGSGRKYDKELKNKKEIDSNKRSISRENDKFNNIDCNNFINERASENENNLYNSNSNLITEIHNYYVNDNQNKNDTYRFCENGNFSNKFKYNEKLIKLSNIEGIYLDLLI